jgi:hypothetical protein
MEHVRPTLTVAGCRFSSLFFFRCCSSGVHLLSSQKLPFVLVPNKLFGPYASLQNDQSVPHPTPYSHWSRIFSSVTKTCFVSFLHTSTTCRMSRTNSPVVKKKGKSKQKEMSRTPKCWLFSCPSVCVPQTETVKASRRDLQHQQAALPRTKIVYSQHV